MATEYNYNCNDCDENFESINEELNECPGCKIKIDQKGPFWLKYEEDKLYECSECGSSVEHPNDVCSQSCFNAMMR
mgnify:FL=1|tara:strand:+ start:360 stop:587 length:228 start_codon:yes stop_codon:yes gene_type:complete